MDPQETIAIFLEGSADLDWNVSPVYENGFEAVNPVTGQEITIRQITKISIDQDWNILNRKSDTTYELDICLNPKADIGAKAYTNICTGDYNKNCDNLLQALFRTAKQKAQCKLLGPVPVSNG